MSLRISVVEAETNIVRPVFYTLTLLEEGDFFPDNLLLLY